jgi:hypothetical protein
MTLWAVLIVSDGALWESAEISLHRTEADAQAAADAAKAERVLAHVWEVEVPDAD